ncbi:hypothetical protein [Neisseria elongata]|uniref:hypothetical protein n=1 Tax=Neisseria elongata TaxID=495 RepID=UPI00131B48C0|nr:hypothetical protein [Neisseria elongata]
MSFRRPDRPSEKEWMMSRKKYGGIYEIALPENKYLYVCLIERLHFDVFDICPNKPINDGAGSRLKTNL